MPLLRMAFLCPPSGLATVTPCVGLAVARNDRLRITYPGMPSSAATWPGRAAPG